MLHSAGATQLDEILQYLKRSASADGTHPRGTIYFVKNGDIRSVARHDRFPEAVKELEKLGVSAQIIKGTLPMNKNDVQGVVMGTSEFRLESIWQHDPARCHLR